jgi:hypothetical protein
MTYQINQAGAGVVRDSHYAYSNSLAGRVKTLLLEGTSTNLILQSEDLTTSWTLVNSAVTANGLVGPTNALVADKLTETAVTNVFQATQSVTKAASALPYVLSVYAYAGERTFVTLMLDDGTTANGVGAYFNLSAGTAGAPSNAIGGYTTVFPGATTGIEPLGSGWYRIWIAGTSTAGTTIRSILGLSSTGAVFSYAGSAGSGAWFVGMQLEQLPYMTSYIATTTVAVVRNSDVLTFPFTTLPQGMSIYDRYIVGHPPDVVANQYSDVLVVGGVSNGSANDFLIEGCRLSDSGTCTEVGAVIIASVTTSSTSVNVAYNIGDTIERLLTVSPAGVATLTVSVNGGVPVVGAAGAAGGLPAAFSNAQISLSANVNASAMAYLNIHIELGVQTLAYMRTAAGQ